MKKLLLSMGALLLVITVINARQEIPPIRQGRFTAEKETLRTYEIPEWFADAKFGIWSHWGPQAVPSFGDWYYRTGQKYMTSDQVVQMLVDVVSKNGNLLLNVVQTPEGDLEPDVIEILEGIAVWIADNGRAIYGSRPWEIYGEGPSMADQEKSKFGGLKDVRPYSDGDLRFTTKDGVLYVFCMTPPRGDIRIASLGQDNPLNRKVASVKMVSTGKKLVWAQNPDALIVTRPAGLPDYATTVYEIKFKD